MDDNQFYKAIQRDNEKAFECLFCKYYKRLCDFCLQFSITTEMAEEVVSDVFLNLWMGRGKSEITNIRSFLYSSVKNRSLNALTTINNNVVSIEDHHTFSSIDTPDVDDIEKQYILRGKIKAVKEVVDQMPLKRRVIFILNKVDGLKYKEIAEILNISVYTIQNQMIKALKSLHQYCPYEKISENYY